MSRTETTQERKAGIIAATIRVLARDGIAETTTRKIAAEANVNQAMLRYYFGSKDDLLFAVLQEMMHTTREIVRQAMPIGCDIKEAIQDGLTAFWEHVEAASELQIIQYELTLYALRNPQSAWLAKQQYDGYNAVVEMLFEEAFTTAGQTNTVSFAELARFIVGGMDGLILQFISDRDRERARRDLKNLIKAVIALLQS